MSTSFMRITARVMIVCMLGMMAPVQASMMPTESTSATYNSAEREKVQAFLAREDVVKQMEAYGVTTEAAVDRVAALSDDEVHQLANKIDSLPAGGSDILGVILTIFVVLLITDILGFTKIFPFTRSIR